MKNCVVFGRFYVLMREPAGTASSGGQIGMRDPAIWVDCDALVL